MTVPLIRGCNHVATTTADLDRCERLYADAVGGDVRFEIQQLGSEWSLFFRDPDGMELEVCAPATPAG